MVPTKVFPSSSRMKDMGFVEKAGINLKELQETLITELHYDTKSYGARAVPEARMFAKASIQSLRHKTAPTWPTYSQTLRTLALCKKTLVCESEESGSYSQKIPRLSCQSAICESYR